MYAVRKRKPPGHHARLTRESDFSRERNVGIDGSDEDIWEGLG